MVRTNLEKSNILQALERRFSSSSHFGNQLANQTTCQTASLLARLWLEPHFPNVANAGQPSA